jgi:hypothetical protein
MSLPKPGQYSVQDASLKQTIALPGAAGTTVNSSNIDLGPLHGISSRPVDFEILVEVPALTLARLPNTSVETYTIEASNDPAFGSGVLILGQTTQTGATGTSSQPAQELRFKVPGTCPEYLRLQIVSDSNGANASAVSASIQLVF